MTSVVLKWCSVAEIDPSEEPTDYIYETSGDLVDIGDGDESEIAGKFRLYYIDVDRACSDGMSAFDVFDGYQTTMDYYSAIFSVRSEDYSRRLTRLLGDFPLGRNVLILDRLELLPKYRGQGLGLSVLRAMVQRFGHGAKIVAMKPFPLQLECRSSGSEQSAWRQQLDLSSFSPDERTATRKLLRYYARLGFMKLQGTPFMFRLAEQPLPALEEDDV